MLFRSDLTKMLRASGVSARVRLGVTPFSDSALEAIRAEPSLFDVAVTGGDDYELLATVAPDKASDFENAAKAVGTPMTCIGEVIAGRDAPEFFNREGARKTFARGSYSHF